MASVKRFESIKCITLVLMVLIANTERSICLIKNIYFEKNTTLVNLRKNSKSCKMLQSLRLKELINASIGTHDNTYFNLLRVVSGGSYSKEELSANKKKNKLHRELNPCSNHQATNTFERRMFPRQLSVLDL